LKNPGYYNLDGHTETVQVDYDPSKISYGDLLNVFWRSHSPEAPPYSRQYASIIFYHNDAQRETADASKQEQEKKLGSKILTEIIPFTAFYPAEDYHQKYYLQQQRSLMSEFKAMYPDFKGFIHSTAAARINGFLGSSGSPDLLQKELSSYGLSQQGVKKLLEVIPSSYGICPVP
jgi:peptide-methionine (S)-S-oxide reductase